jgi:HAD superfamily hydrolase (TIGR01549 family)
MAAPDLLGDAEAVLLDLDGTLVDSNYQHALAWFRAFRAHGIVLPVWRLHRHVGMGGDQLVKSVAGQEVEDELGDRLRAAEKSEFAPLRDECEPLDGIPELVSALDRRGLRIVLASSSPAKDLDYFLDSLDLRGRVHGWTTADDVERSKPHPDVVHAALDRAGTRAAVMIGDSRWDVESAANADVPTICVITGGWSEQELLDAGADAVFDSLGALAEALDGR